LELLQLYTDKRMCMQGNIDLQLLKMIHWNNLSLYLITLQNF